MPAEAERPDAVLSTCQNEKKGDLELPVLYPTLLSEHPTCAPKTLLPLTAHLGLPLYFSICDTSIEQSVLQEVYYGQIDPLEYELIEPPDNPILTLFLVQKRRGGGLNVNVGHLEESSRPKVLLARVDGKELTIEHVTVMSLFVTLEIIKAKAEPGSWGAFEVRYPGRYNIYDHITPEKFVDFWVAHCKVIDEFGECPVKLGCRSCEKTTGVTLQRCGKCRVAKYCSSECQKADWALHKKSCSKY